MNVILIGMPGCGKTTLGQLAAERLGRPFYDSDAEIQCRAGRTIPEIFAKDGEEAFRAMETACIEDLLRLNGIVLSVGGGAVERNAARLREGGLVLYIERGIEDIVKTLQPGSRPLLEGGAEARLRAIYERRRARYEQTCHARIGNHDTLETALEAMLAAVEKEI